MIIKTNRLGRVKLKKEIKVYVTHYDDEGYCADIAPPLTCRDGYGKTTDEALADLGKNLVQERENIKIKLHQIYEVLGYEVVVR